MGKDASSYKNSLKNDFVYKKDTIDTYLHPGEQTGGLVLSEEKRAQFFQDHPTLEPLLRREENNPLLEEGKIREDLRDRKGEFYLTHEAITLLVEKKIIQEGGPSYNKKNIFIVSNDTDKLKNILQGLNLSNNEDAKFIYIKKIYAIPFYLRKENGKIKCFIVDADLSGLYGDIIHSLTQAFTDLCIVSSQTPLQKDFYSCSTFAIKALMYFAKHGSEIFPQIEKTITLTPGQHSLNKLALMPTLLKMSQHDLDDKLPATTLDAIVSQKEGKNLREYLSEYRRIIDDKTFNTAALVKKYNYFSELNSIIQSQTEGDLISENTWRPLPDNFKRIHEKFSVIPVIASDTLEIKPQQQHHTSTGLFDSKYSPDFKETLKKLEQIDKCYVKSVSQPAARAQEAESQTRIEGDQLVAQLLASYQNNETALPYLQQIIQDIQKNWNIINKDTTPIIEYADHTGHGQYGVHYDSSRYRFLMPYCQLAYLSEHNGIPEEHALKLSVLFDNPKDALGYIRANIQKNPLAIHDACLFNLPDVSQCHFEQWKRLIKINMHDANFRQLLANAPELEKLLRENKPQEGKKLDRKING